MGAPSVPVGTTRATTCGGGVTRGSVSKKMAAAVAGSQAVLYASGEESVAQVTLRAQRLGLSGGKLELVTETDLPAILTLAGNARAALLVIDSIQTVQAGETGGSAGATRGNRSAWATTARAAQLRST